MNICFVGNSDKGYFVSEVAKELNGTCRFVQEALDIQTQTNAILSEPADFVVYDISQYTINPDALAVEIIKIQNSNNSKSIIFAAGYLPKSEMIQALLKKDLQLFVISSIPSGKKDQLHKCINGYYAANPNPLLEQKIDEDVAAIEQAEKKTVAVVGVMPRIGTTTQAIQIVKYLMLKGWKACYIEMNPSEYVENVYQLDDDVEYDKELEKVTLNGVDMFYNIDRLAEYLKLDYDYFVYDFGVFNGRDFNKVSYLEKDIKIAVCGYKYNEISHTMEFLRNPFYEDVYYVFSFIEKTVQKEIKNYMEEKADKTYFAEYTPDMYYFKNNNTFYEKIIRCEKNENITKKKKFTIFKKR